MGKATVSDLVEQISKARKAWKPGMMRPMLRRRVDQEDLPVELDDGRSCSRIAAVGESSRRPRKKKESKKTGAACSFFTEFLGEKRLKSWLQEKGFRPTDSKRGLKASLYYNKQEILLDFSEDVRLVKVKEKAVR